MRYCTRCLYPANHPLNIVFDDEGVCSGCRVHEEKDVLDWDERLRRLRRVVAPFKDPSGGRADCIVPVSGARDSFFIVHVVKHVLGLHPLLVSYNKQYNTALGIRNLARLRTIFDCDFMSHTASPDSVRRVTRATLRAMGSMYWHCLAGETAYPVQIAARLKIPLIIWGAHQGLDQVGMFSHLHEPEMTRKYRREHDLMGFEAEDLLAFDPSLEERDVLGFLYPDDNELEAVGVRGIYLGNFLRWDSKAQHEAMIDRYGYAAASVLRTFDTYSDVDSLHYTGVHDYTKYCKWGYSKVLDHCCREIRLKRLTREQGIELVRRHQQVEPADMDVFFHWLGMERGEFTELVDTHRSPDVWTREGRDWVLADSVLNHMHDEGVEQARLPVEQDCRFRTTHASVDDTPEGSGRAILVGRGWEDGEAGHD
ncbi:N-acetyl sugar amidotransferase [Desulfocurvus sp. DL9XJH121]